VIPQVNLVTDFLTLPRPTEQGLGRAEQGITLEDIKAKNEAVEAFMQLASKVTGTEQPGCPA